MKFEPIPVGGARTGAARPRIGAWPALSPLFAAALAAAVAIATQALWLPVDADVSWLITVSERVLAGDRLYLDIFEVNPPASVWLYLPLVWLAQLLGLRPEAVVVAAFLAAGLASVAATMALASRLRDAPPPPLLAGILSFVALVLPMALFAQREHAALLLALPALAAVALIAEGRPIGRATLLASGLAAGLIIVIKPYFLPAVVAPALWAAWRRRSLSPFVLPIAAGALAVLAYGLAVVTFAGAYFQWLPVIAQTYMPMHDSWWKVAVGPALYPALCLLLMVLLRPARIPALGIVWGLGSAGFLVAAVAQGKNYANHWLPQTALALAAACSVVTLPRIAPARSAAIGFALAIVALSPMYQWVIRPDPAVAGAIARNAPQAPKIIALSPQLATGHPVTRNAGGTWVGSRAGLFTASGARFVGFEGSVARKAYRDDIRAFATDVQRNSPDVILVDRKSKRWLLREPEVASALHPYAPAATAAETEIWVRQP